MVENTAETLRKAITNLINVKIHDALAHPDGLNRLLAHRLHGVASPQIRDAERRLEQILAETVPRTPDPSVTKRGVRRLSIIGD